MNEQTAVRVGELVEIEFTPSAVDLDRANEIADELMGTWDTVQFRRSIQGANEDQLDTLDAILMGRQSGTAGQRRSWLTDAAVEISQEWSRRRGWAPMETWQARDVDLG